MNDPFGAVAATPPGVADALNGFCQEDPPLGGHTLRGFDERIDALAAEQDRLVATGDRRGVFQEEDGVSDAPLGAQRDQALLQRMDKLIRGQSQ